MFCNKCGETLPDDATFCGNCGNPIRGAQSMPSSGAATASYTTAGTPAIPGPMSYGIAQKKKRRAVPIVIGAAAIVAILAVVFVVVFGPKDVYLTSTVTYYSESGAPTSEFSYTYFEDGAIATYSFRLLEGDGKEELSTYRQVGNGLSQLVETKTAGETKQYDDSWNTPQVTLNEDGNVAQIVRIHTSTSSSSTSTLTNRYTYHKNGKLAQHETVRGDENNSLSSIATYDEDGKLISSNFSSSYDPSSNAITEYSYSDSSEKDCTEVTAKMTKNNGEVTYKRARIQYEDGRIVAIWSFSDELQDYYLSATYTYEKIENPAPLARNVSSITDNGGRVMVM